MKKKNNNFNEFGVNEKHNNVEQINAPKSKLPNTPNFGPAVTPGSFTNNYLPRGQQVLGGSPQFNPYHNGNGPFISSQYSPLLSPNKNDKTHYQMNTKKEVNNVIFENKNNETNHQSHEHQNNHHISPDLDQISPLHKPNPECYNVNTIDLLKLNQGYDNNLNFDPNFNKEQITTNTNNQNNNSDPNFNKLPSSYSAQNNSSAPSPFLSGGSNGSSPLTPNQQLPSLLTIAKNRARFQHGEFGK